MMTRRKLLRAGAAAGAAALGAAYPLMRRRARPAGIGGGAPDVYRGLRVAFVGVTGKGGSNLYQFAGLGVQVVALCDVDRGRLAQRAGTFPGAKTYADFRTMLAEMHDRIDAVVIATPDHTHAVAAMAAMRRGKHVYCEKPLAHDIDEVRALAAAARDLKVATQMGNQGHADANVRRQVDWLRAGAVGDVREVHVWTDRPTWPQGVERPTEERPAPPAEVDWDLWLGPAPARPWAVGPEEGGGGTLEPSYHPFNWRGWWDFGTGALGDMGCHLLDAACWALELTGPCTVGAVQEGMTTRSGPRSSVITWRFPARPGIRNGVAGELPPVKVVWYDGNQRPPKPDGVTDEEWERNSEAAAVFVGDRGAMFSPYTRLPVLSAKAAKRFQPPATRQPYFLPASPGHFHEWLDACLGGPAPASHFGCAGPFTETVLLGNLALRVGRPIDWDPTMMRARNAPEADPLIRRAYRKGWELA